MPLSSLLRAPFVREAFHRAERDNSRASRSRPIGRPRSLAAPPSRLSEPEPEEALA